MAHTQQEQNSPADRREHEDEQQAELFAASAAEGAITDRKTSDTDGHHQLTIPTEQHALNQTQKEQPIETQSSDEANSDSSQKLDQILSKEELVEEALNCPCIASMRDGPCGDSFIAAYKCFLESETEPKGMDCMDQFKGMQTCMAEHPEEYNLDDDDDDDDADPFASRKRSEEDEHVKNVDSTVDRQDSKANTPAASASS